MNEIFNFKILLMTLNNLILFIFYGNIITHFFFYFSLWIQ